MSATTFLPPPRPIIEPRPVVPGTPASWVRLPTMESNEVEDREFVARVINHKAAIRSWAVTQAALNERFYIGDHWAMPYARAARDGMNYRFKLDRRYSSYFRSTTNLIAQASDNQTTRISLREFVPTTRPRRGSPSIETAARAAKSYLLHHLGQIAWEQDKREDAISHMVIHATVGLISTMEKRWLQAPNILSSAYICPACGEKYGNNRLPATMVESFKTNLDAVRQVPVGPDEEEQVEFGMCVTCESRDELKPYDPDRRDLTRPDQFGLPLGMPEPGTGGPNLEVLPVFRTFFENGGIMTQPHTQRYCGYELPRSMEWIAEHLGHLLDLDALYPEDPRTLFAADPILGGEFHQWYSSQGDIGVYDQHALVKTVVIQPQWSCPKGLVVTQVNDQIIKEPLLKSFTTPTGEQREVEVVKLAFARYKRVPGLCWGRTNFSDGIGIQRRINRIDTMEIWLREHGQPQFYLPPGVSVSNIDEGDDDEGLSLRRFRVANAPPNWDIAKALFPGLPMTGNIYEQERQIAITDMGRVFGPVTIERGMTTTSDPKTTTGLALLRNEAAKEREPAEQAFSHMCELGWSHQLELTYAFQTEEDVYAVKTAAGRREFRAFSGADILDHVDVEIDTQDEDETINEIRDGTAQAIQMQLYDMNDPDAREQALENMHLPRNVNEQRGIQMRSAEAAWAAFLARWTLPHIDYSLHEPQIWFSILGRRWLDDDGEELREAVGWAQVVPKLAGWPENLAKETQRDAAQRAAYGSVPPEQWAEKYVELGQTYAATKAAAQAAERASIGTGGAPMLPQLPLPVEPPDPGVGFLPLALEERIAIVLMRQLDLPVDGLPHPTDRGLPEATRKAAMLVELVKMYAVILAYGELRKAPGPPAPGGMGEPPQGQGPVPVPQGAPA